MSDLKQFHLTGTGFSGRGVRLRVLTSAARSAAQQEAARALGDVQPGVGAAGLYEDAKMRSILCKIVARVTDPGVKPDGILTAKWTKVSAMDLGLEGAGSLTSLFGPKDLDVLSSYVNRTYYATVAEADTILGGMLAVSED